MSIKDFSKLFFGLLILHLAVIYRPDSMVLYYISKPALVFSLLAFFRHRSEEWDAAPRTWFSLALLFSLIGDVVLMLEGESLFLVGMAAFSLAHIGYITFYGRLKLGFNSARIALASLFPILVTLGMYYFIDTPPELELFLYLYAFIIGVHFVMSTGFMRLGGRFAIWPTLGATSFIISDYLLAYSLFNSTGVWLKMGVMLTYGLAQYLIVTGVIQTIESKTRA